MYLLIYVDLAEVTSILFPLFKCYLFLIRVGIKATSVPESSTWGERNGFIDFTRYHWL